MKVKEKIGLNPIMETWSEWYLLKSEIFLDLDLLCLLNNC